MKQSDIYKLIEDKVINQLENGIIPWRRRYHVTGGDLCVSHQSGKPYSLLNQFLLDEPGEYWTFEQAKKAGYKIRKGSHAQKIVFWKILTFEDTSKAVDLNGEEVEYTRGIPFLKWYNVFHESDVEGLVTKKSTEIPEEERKRRNMESNQKAEAIIANYLCANKDISMVTSNRTPCFVPSTNTIHIPRKCQFDKIADYYDTAFHEIIHSTKEMVNRPIEHSIEGRAREELVAEIGAAYLCGNAGIEDEDVIKNNSAYCASWLKALKNNIKMLVWASSRAEKAAKYVLGDTEEQPSGEE